MTILHLAALALSRWMPMGANQSARNEVVSTSHEKAGNFQWQRTAPRPTFFYTGLEDSFKVVWGWSCLTSVLGSFWVVWYVWFRTVLRWSGDGTTWFLFGLLPTGNLHVFHMLADIPRVGTLHMNWSVWNLNSDNSTWFTFTRFPHNLCSTRT